MDYEYSRVENEVAYNGFNEYDENDKANKLCGISLACLVGPGLLCFLFGALLAILPELETLVDLLFGLLALLDGGGKIASIVLMIYVRVKYPKNKFGKILMWIYILLIILSLLAVSK